MKSSPRFYGPFDIVKRIGLIGYELKSPDECNLHNVFHVSLLRKYVSDSNHVLSKHPKVDLGRELLEELENILQVDTQHLWNKSL
jgi:hypothetical protein